ncbi:MAG: response regulator transcription factor [Sandaracinus sp.]|nr:response regulator transcription factor [Sandaracinus sp.]MCB9620393.1 response regulator transcription factor [Sandaracinus sp.]
MDALVAAGARGVVSKDADLEVLVEAVREVATGASYFPDAHVAPHHGSSGQERAVFDALLASKRPKEIAFELGLSLSTVYTYAERVRKKLGVEDVRDVVSYAHREGLLDTEE